MTDVTCRLTAKNRDQLRNPTLGNRVWATFFTFGDRQGYRYTPVRQYIKESAGHISSASWRVTLSICFFACLFQAIVCKHGIIHKTRSAQCITTPPEKHRAAAISNTHRKFGEVQTRGFSLQTDMLTDTLITIRGMHPYGGGGAMNPSVWQVDYTTIQCDRDSEPFELQRVADLGAWTSGSAVHAGRSTDDATEVMEIEESGGATDCERSGRERATRHTRRAARRSRRSQIAARRTDGGPAR